MKRLILLALACGAATSAVSATGDVRYAPVPAWVVAAPAAPEGAAKRGDAPIRFAYLDNQVRIGPDGEETFTAYRMTILKHEALANGNITLTWSPDTGSATVHRLAIIRDGRTIDVLATTKFRVIQREARLEQSMLDGLLTATLEAPGLQVGDTLDFAATITRREPALDGHVAGMGQLPVLGMEGAFRYRLVWPDAHRLTWRASPDLPKAMPASANGETSLAYTLANPAGSVPTEGAPPRFNVRRLIEYSDYASWRALSRQMAMLFDQAAQLAPTSPLRAEAAAIAAASVDPAARVQATLRLVEERVRYVFVGLDGGNYRPASADETWTRRFGDCKAKTVLLLALLRANGIDAEAVLVNAAGGGGDGFDQRLPSPRLFDHVLVRAHVGGRSYWLDGTRAGDHYLDMLPPVQFRRALPISAAGHDLEAVPPAAPAMPELVGLVDIDATAGIEQDAVVKVANIVRADEAYAINAQLAALSPEDAQRAMRSYWRQQIDWVTPDKVSWSYDERHASLTLSMEGRGGPEWKGDDTEGHSLTLPGAGFFPPDRRMRPIEQDQAAPWATTFPRFRCWATVVRLPPAHSGLYWTFHERPVNRTLGGVAYWRAATLDHGIMRSVMSSRTLVPEISAAEAADANRQIPGFDNDMSSVSETLRRPPATPDAAGPPPFTDRTDWIVDPAPCSAPEKARDGG